MGDFSHALFTGLLWQRTTFNAYLLPEKSTDNFLLLLPTALMAGNE
jgi:hypothetical protein